MAAGSLLYSMAAGPGRVLSIPTLINVTGQKVILPFYHAVSDTPQPHLRHSFHVRSTEQFCEDLDFYMKHFRPLSVDDLLEAVQRGKKFSGPGFFITFDDGLSSFYHAAAPILASRGVGAACFINPSFADNKNLFYRYKVNLIIEKILSRPEIIKTLPTDYRNEGTDSFITMLKKLTIGDTHKIDHIAGLMEIDFRQFMDTEKPYMTSAQICELSAAGFFFGGHSMDHPLYSSLPLEKQIDQTMDSVDWVCRVTGQKTRLFSFPFTDHGVRDTFFESVKDVDLTFGTAGLKSDPRINHFQRIPMETTRDSAETVIKTQYLYYFLKWPFGKNTVSRHD